MYDYAGEWVYRVGLPAKSGVAGGILAVLPGQLGIGVFSPPLDPRGNSVRGVAACEALSDEQELHFLRAPRASLSTLRARFDLATCPSKRVRVDQRREALQKTGHRAVVYQLQGDLCFAGMEQVVRRLGDESRELSHLVLDLTRVHDVDLPASRMIIELVATPCDEGFHIAFVGLERLTRLKRMLSEARSANAFPERSSHFDDLDLALEWCEDRLLEAQGLTTSRSEELELEKHAFLENLDGCEREILARFDTRPDTDAT